MIFFNRHLIFTISLLFFSSLYISCSPIIKYADKTSNSYQIRVKLKTATFPLEISGNKLTITDSITGQILVKHNSKLKITISQSGKNLLINNNITNSNISIKSLSKNPIYINNRCYFGEIRINVGLNPLIVNHIPIETYLLSVVPSEVPSTFEYEALKAQTIIARTYSYYFLLSRQNEAFDVDDTTSYQVYNGFANLIQDSKASHRIFKAISSTSNIIITYEKKPIVAYFHANSGGKTKSGLSYFGSKSDFPYLIEHDDPYSVNQPAYSWSYKMNLSDFYFFFSQNATISQNEFCSYIKSKDKTFDTKTIRKMIGYTKIKSETFKVDINQNEAIFTGFGYGHGVGLSQWGANQMAKQNFTFQQIINFYYPNTTLDKF